MPRRWGEGKARERLCATGERQFRFRTDELSQGLYGTCRLDPGQIPLFDRLEILVDARTQL
jgi:hypothetical protein